MNQINFCSIRVYEDRGVLIIINRYHFTQELLGKCNETLFFQSLNNSPPNHQHNPNRKPSTPQTNTTPPTPIAKRLISETEIYGRTDMQIEYSLLKRRAQEQYKNVV